MRPTSIARWRRGESASGGSRRSKGRKSASAERTRHVVPKRRDVDRERKRERARHTMYARSDALRKGKYPRYTQ